MEQAVTIELPNVPADVLDRIAQRVRDGKFIAPLRHCAYRVAPSAAPYRGEHAGELAIQLVDGTKIVGTIDLAVLGEGKVRCRANVPHPISITAAAGAIVLMLTLFGGVRLRLPPENADAQRMLVIGGFVVGLVLLALGLVELVARWVRLGGPLRGVMGELETLVRRECDAADDETRERIAASNREES